MSASAAPDLATEVREAAIRHLWRQWQAVGGAVSGPGQANAIVDPEVLILTSLWILDHERRLADVTGSWVRINSALLSIQRLGNLSRQFPEIAIERLGSLAAVGLAAKDIRWKSLRSKRASSDLGMRDNKVRAIEAPLRSWATLMLQLRRGMGVGAKADVLTYLLGINVTGLEWASVATIAEETGYTPAAVRRVADDLAAASFIRVPGTGEGGRSLQRMYSADPAAWVQLLRIGTHQPGWGYWRERFLFVIALLQWLESLRSRKVSAYARDVEARELLTRHIGAIRRDRVVDPMELSGAELNAEYLNRVAKALINWMGNRG